ncbi:MAG: hypothetical protein ACJAYU_003963 [Bradymonadia bacterium]|jgi:hypothetical protein
MVMMGLACLVAPVGRLVLEYRDTGHLSDASIIANRKLEDD